MTHEELILELKDISPPGEPGWWLLAPGYMIIILLILSLSALTWLVLLRRKTRRRFTAANLELERIRMAHLSDQDSLQLARELAQWLKQVSLLAFPQAGIEGKTGSDWLSFLDSSLGDTSFTRGDGKIFGDAIYQRYADPEARRLLSLCQRWLLAVKPRLLQRGQH